MIWDTINRVDKGGIIVVDSEIGVIESRKIKRSRDNIYIIITKNTILTQYTHNQLDRLGGEREREERERGNNNNQPVKYIASLILDLSVIL